MMPTKGDEGRTNETREIRSHSLSRLPFAERNKTGSFWEKRVCMIQLGKVFCGVFQLYIKERRRSLRGFQGLPRERKSVRKRKKD